MGSHEFSVYSMTCMIPMIQSDLALLQILQFFPRATKFPENIQSD